MFSNVHLRNHKYYIIGAKSCWCTVSESPTPISFLDLSVAHKIWRENLMARSLILTHSLRVATVALSARGLVWQRCDTTLCSSRNSAIADKPRDAFRGQSRLPRSPWDIRFQICRNLENRVTGSSRSLKVGPFDILCTGYGFLLVFYSNFSPKTSTIFEIFDFKSAVTLKTGLELCQGHWKCHHSIERIMTSY